MKNARCPKCGSRNIDVVMYREIEVKPIRRCVIKEYKPSKSSEVECNDCNYFWRSTAKWIEEDRRLTT